MDYVCTHVSNHVYIVYVYELIHIYIYNIYIYMVAVRLACLSTDFCFGPFLALELFVIEPELFVVYRQKTYY